MRIPPYVPIAAAAVVILWRSPAQPAQSAVTSSGQADRIAQIAKSYVGKTTAEAGSQAPPKVSCASTTSHMLIKAGVPIKHQLAVTTNGGLVKALQDAGWKTVPRSQAVPGCVVWHDRNAQEGHGPEHVGACSTQGCTTAFNTKGGFYVNDNYPERYKQYIDGGDRLRGGILCP